MWLILSKVPLAKYGPEPLERALRDLDVVAELAVAHEAVVEFFARGSRTTVLPMKMFTMFSSVERAIAEMRERQTQINGVLDRVAGCEEWGVRVTTGARSAVRVRAEQPRSGTAFLTARKQARDAARAIVRKSADAGAQTFRELSALARDTRQRTDVPAGAVPPVLDAAFLISSRNRQKFRAAVKRLTRHCTEAGAVLTLTGPWPPYNFVHMSGD